MDDFEKQVQTLENVHPHARGFLNTNKLVINSLLRLVFSICLFVFRDQRKDAYSCLNYYIQHFIEAVVKKCAIQITRFNFSVYHHGTQSSTLQFKPENSYIENSIWKSHEIKRLSVDGYTSASALRSCFRWSVKMCVCFCIIIQAKIVGTQFLFLKICIWCPKIWCLAKIVGF